MPPRRAAQHREIVVTDLGNAAPNGFTALEIREALERVKNSTTLRASRKLLQLLEFVVEMALRGKADQLKETTIAVSVFGRAADYDPKADTVVRNQALRLRLKLKHYYESEGGKDPVIIEIPKGHYAPRFVSRGLSAGSFATAPHRRSHV
jgi:hypothetical protein